MKSIDVVLMTICWQQAPICQSYCDWCCKTRKVQSDSNLTNDSIKCWFWLHKDEIAVNKSPDTTLKLVPIWDIVFIMKIFIVVYTVVILQNDSIYEENREEYSKKRLWRLTPEGLRWCWCRMLVTNLKGWWYSRSFSHQHHNVINITMSSTSIVCLNTTETSQGWSKPEMAG